MGLSLSLSLSLSSQPLSLPSLSPRAWPNPEAQRHCSTTVTFDGPGLKQIYIPLVDFKRCLNNDASQRRVNEACSGLATSDFKINLIRGRDIICAPPSSFCSFALTLRVCLFSISPLHFPPLSSFQSSPHFSVLSLSQLCSSSLPFTPAPQ